MAAEHQYTLHSTYTGSGCAICGQRPNQHPDDYWLVEGKRVPFQSHIELPDDFGKDSDKLIRQDLLMREWTGDKLPPSYQPETHYKA